MVSILSSVNTNDWVLVAVVKSPATAVVIVFFLASPPSVYTTLKTRSKAEYKLPALTTTAGLPHDLNTCI